MKHSHKPSATFDPALSGLDVIQFDEKGDRCKIIVEGDLLKKFPAPAKDAAQSKGIYEIIAPQSTSDFATMVADAAAGVSYGKSVYVRFSDEDGISFHEILSSVKITKEGDFYIAFFTDLQGTGKILQALQSENAKLQRRNRELITTDEKTNLPKKNMMPSHIRLAISASQTFCLAYVAIAGLERLPSASAADSLLILLVERLKKNLRSNDVITVGEGHTFHMLIKNAGNEESARLALERLMLSIQSPLVYDDRRIYLTASIGARLSDATLDSNTLMSNAEYAQLQAKKEGSGKIVFFDPQQQTTLCPSYLEDDMRLAFELGEFFLVYQPIVDAETKNIRGVEALMRWRKGDGTIVPPNVFIPAAEENGLIEILGSWSLRAACREVKLLHEKTGFKPYLSVNVSPVQLKAKRFHKIVSEALKISELEPEYLALEVTEGGMIQNMENSVMMLNQLIEAGVKIALDDFGTGYSSLAYVKDIPAEIVKIDRAFVKDLPESKKDAAICIAVQSMAKALGCRVVAEGVETIEQLTLLKEIGVELIQGYFTGKPTTIEDITEKLLQQN